MSWKSAQTATLNVIRGIIGLEPVRHVALAALLIATMGAGLFYFRSYGEVTSDLLTKDIIQSLKVAQLADEDCADMTGAQRKRLLEQYEAATLRASHHLNALTLFYRNYYLSISMALLAGFCASVCLAAIAKVGWSNASRYLLTSFAIFLGVASFYGVFPNAFRQPENIAENRERFLAYINLRESMRTFVRIGCDGVPKGDGAATCSAATFVREIDAQLAAINSISIGFEPTSVTSTIEQLRRQAGDLSKPQ